MRYHLPLIALYVCLTGFIPATYATEPPKTVLRDIGKPITEGECKQLGSTLEDALKKGDSGTYSETMDYEAVFEQASSGLSETPAQLERFKKLFLDKTGQADSYLGAISTKIRKGGTYKLIGVRSRPDGKTIVMRMITADGGMNYHELRVVRRGDSKPRVVDTYVYLSGEFQSEVIRRATITGLNTLARAGNPAENLQPTDQERLAKIKAMADSGKLAEAWEMLSQLPDVEQKTKAFFGQKLDLATKLGGNGRYLETIEQFRTALPNDPSPDIKSYGVFLNKKDYTNAKKSLANLAGALGGDVYLDVLRGSCELAEGKLDTAEATARKALADEPTLPQALDLRIRVALKLKKHDETLELLGIGERRFGLSYSQMKTKPMFQDFIDSPQYLTWLKESTKPPIAPIAPRANAPRITAQTRQPPLADDECNMLGRAFEESLNKGDKSLFLDAMDWSAFIARVAEGVPTKPGYLALFSREFTKFANSSNGIYESLASIAKAGGTYHVLRVHNKPDGKYVLVRTISVDGAFSYKDLKVGRRPDGKPRIIDVYMYDLGQNLSDTMRPMFASTANPDGPVPAKYKGASRDDLKQAFATYAKIKAANDAGKSAEALEYFSEIHPEILRDKSFLSLKLDTARRSGNQENLAQVMEEYRASFPDEPTVDMVLCGYYVIKKDYERLQETVARVAKLIGGDPYLDIYLGRFALSQKKLNEAEVLAKRGFAAEPNMLQAMFLRLDVALTLQKHDETLELLSIADRQFGRKFVKMESEPIWSNFVKSEQYRTWVGRSSQPLPARAAPGRVAVHDIGPPPTDEECQQLGLILQTTVRFGDEKLFATAMDWNALADQIAGLIPRPGLRDALAKGLALKCAHKVGHENGRALGTCTHSCRSCFALQ